MTSTNEKPMRVLVTGSRKHSDRAQVLQALTGLRAWLNLERNQLFGPSTNTVLVHGAAQGLDRTASEIAADTLSWQTEAHPASWRDENGVYRPSAGFDRNKAIIARTADLVIGFPTQTKQRARQLKESTGTWHCLDAALRSPAATPIVLVSWKPETSAEHMIYPYSDAARELLSSHDYLTENQYLSIRCQDLGKEKEQKP